MVEIELGPNAAAVDIIEARVFDHATRELLSSSQRNVGWRVAAPNVLQCFAFKRKLPAKLDVWVRAHSHDPTAPVSTIPAVIGAKAQTIAGEVSVVDLRQGYWLQNGSKLSRQVDEEQPAATAAFSFNYGDDGEYQIAAVSKSGRRGFPDTPHYLRPFPQRRVVDEVFIFPMPLDEIDHFEIRQFGGRHRFFFEAVELPQTSPAPLGSPPVVRVPIQGQEISQPITDWAPLECTIATRRGNWGSGAAASAQGAWILSRPGGPTDVNGSFTVLYYLHGASAYFDLQFFEAPSGKAISQSQLKPSASSGSWGNSSAGREVFNVPLHTIDAVEVKLRP